MKKLADMELHGESGQSRTRPDTISEKSASDKLVGVELMA